MSSSIELTLGLYNHSGLCAAATTIVGTSGVDFASLTTLDNYFVGAQQG